MAVVVETCTEALLEVMGWRGPRQLLVALRVGASESVGERWQERVETDTRTTIVYVTSQIMFQYESFHFRLHQSPRP